MPSKKQRRRQAKERRHEYEYVYVDEEGREVEVEEPEPRPAAKDGTSKAAKTTDRGGGRRARKIEPPSWRKAAKRGALFGAVFVVIFLLTKPKGANSVGIAAQGIAFALFFIPLFYFTDSMVYRSYLKRTGQALQARERKQPKPKT